MLYLFLTSLWTLLSVPPHVVSECRAPAHLSPGEVGDIVWTVHCTEAPTSARFELTLPEGLTLVSPIARGGRLVRNGASVRYVWETLPAVPALKVGVRVAADRGYRTSALAPTLSLLVNGRRSDVALQPAALPAAFQAPTGPTTARREVSIDGPDVATVTVVVSGLEPGAFLRIEETLPPGCTAEAENLDGATVTADRSGLRFVWFEGTASGSARISYRILGPEAACFEGIEGVVTHVKGGVKTQTPTQSQSQSQSPPRFHVQLVATHRTITSAFFTRRHRFSADVTRWEHEGWTKYTTGNHVTYAEARASRNAIRAAHRFPGPFVTASHNGRRITVQEALLLTSQTWTPE
jgi:hypothetical protein